MNRTLTILYVEDCEATAELFKMSLTRHGQNTTILIDIAVSVADAVVQFTASRHAAVIVDWNLPDGNGSEVAQWVRNQSSTLPIVFLSAILTSDHDQLAQQFSPALCLVKDHSKEFVDTILDHIMSA